MIITLPSNIGPQEVQAWAEKLNCDVRLMRDGHLMFVNRQAVHYDSDFLAEDQPVPHKKKRTTLRLFTGAKA